ncbi:MAG: endo-1,4-beta-xylanase [Bacteroidota bacterium]
MSYKAFLIFFLCIGILFAEHKTDAQSSLKSSYQDKFMVGAALSGYRIMGRDPKAMDLVREQFNTLTAENDMKWERIHPEPGRYNFKVADRFVEFGEAQGMHMVGHTLIWHNQTPRWVFEDGRGKLTCRDTLLARMRNHIHTLMGRYRGKIHGWDVVNEAVNEDGTLRNSLWRQIIGDDYIERAFTYAREADPEARLIYNDFSLAGKAKREGIIRMVRDLQRKGIRVDAIGMQGHYDLNYPALKGLEASIVAFSELGVEVMITELDVSVLPWPDLRPGAEISGRMDYRPELDPYQEGLPATVQEDLAQRYSALFKVFTRHSDKITRVTFWGVDDGRSWKNNFPVRGRTDYALLFDRKLQPKPAFRAVIIAGSQTLNPKPLSPD